MCYRKSQKGFTLIELLIVIAIILILIAIALPNFLAAQIRSRVARVKADLRTYAIAEESYRLDFGMYTHDSSQGNFELTTPVRYIKDIPFDPFGTSYAKSGGQQVINGLTDSYYKIGTGSIDPCDMNELPNPGCRRRPTGRIDSWDQTQVPRDVFVVASWGPTQQDPFGAISEFPYPMGGGDGWVAYAPTNGTRSYGGMFRVGGGRLMPSYQHMLYEQ